MIGDSKYRFVKKKGNYMDMTFIGGGLKGKIIWKFRSMGRYDSRNTR